MGGRSACLGTSSSSPAPGSRPRAGLARFATRTGEGIWAKFDPMKLATPQAFARDPKRCSRSMTLRRRNLLDARAQRGAFRAGAARAGAGRARAVESHPGDAEHRRSARARGLAARHPHARRTLEGALPALRMASCLARGPRAVEDACPDCGRAGGLRPHVVWFGEMPLISTMIDRALRKADLFVAIGTSGAVYPAAGFVAEARASACGPARSTSRPPTTPTCSTSPATGRRARPRRLGSTNWSEPKSGSLRTVRGLKSALPSGGIVIARSAATKQSREKGTLCDPWIASLRSQ